MIPTLNEASAIRGVITELPKRVRGIPVNTFVVDGNSFDNTIEIAKKAGARVLVQKSKGKGAAIAEALENIREDIIVLIDGDGTYLSEEIAKLVSPILDGKADMVVGTREKREPGSITPFNVLGNKVFNYLITFFYGVRITDMLSGYRAIKREKLESLYLVSRNFEFETELTIEALRENYRVKEIPVFYRNRKGKTKLNPVNDGLRIFKLLVLMVRDTKPLYFFGLLGAFMMFFGLWPVALTIYEKLSLGYVVHSSSEILATFTILFGFQIIVLGLLADMNLRNTKRIEAYSRKLMQPAKKFNR